MDLAKLWTFHPHPSHLQKVRCTAEGSGNGVNNSGPTRVQTGPGRENSWGAPLVRVANAAPGRLRGAHWRAGGSGGVGRPAAAEERGGGRGLRSPICDRSAASS